jgi:hypothetical protein
LAQPLTPRDDDSRWHLIMDNVNIHGLEAVVRLVAAACGMGLDHRAGQNHTNNT